MSDIFHKSCYTARSSGYKYRTLATNTGEKRRRSSREDNTFEKKFKELQKEITTRVNKEMDSSQQARESIHDKYYLISSKIDSMIEFQNTVTELRKQLQNAEYAVIEIINKINRIQNGTSDMSQSQRTLFNKSEPIFEEEFTSTVTHV